MNNRNIPQKTERRISVALRLTLAVVLLVAQVALVFLLSRVLKQHIAIAYTALELLAIVYAIRVYNRPGCSTYKPGWIVLILALPVVGLILYWLWSGDHQSKHLTLKKIAPPKQTPTQQEISKNNIEKLRCERPQWARLATYLDSHDFPLYGHTRTKYFAGGEAYLDDMLIEMTKAERFIFMEYFIMAEGEIWHRLSKILAAKAAQGVEVKLIFDDFGSMLRLHRESIEELRQAGVETQVFNPVHHYVNRLYFNYRDHRKIACIDGKVTYTGGVNIADEYANIIERFGHWKDSGVRLEGEGAWGLCREFIHMWQRMGGMLEHEHDFYRPIGHWEAQGYCQSISDGPDNNPLAVAEDTYLQLIAGARNMVYITTPYLAISDAMMNTLCMTAESGVDVRLMVPGIPDHKFAYLAAECYFGELLRHGVKIYIYEPGLLHGKSVLVDREVAFIGSVNMDYRSFQLHFECGAVLYGAPCLEDLLEDMDSMMEKSHTLSYEEWLRRPWIRRILGPILRLFAMWM
ncbi:MAG: cardiolipin synthase [Eubacteriales bacterium]|nr:cardiolipin synthase [Eubacteriales bacterium]